MRQEPAIFKSDGQVSLRAQPVQVALFKVRCHAKASRNAARGVLDLVRFCLIFFACVSQSLSPVQAAFMHHCASHAAAISMDAASRAEISHAHTDETAKKIICPHHPAASNGESQVPDKGEDCGCCVGLCCASFAHAFGLLPQETANPAFARAESRRAAPPQILGSLRRFVAFAGQPRAPPVLI